MGVKSALVVLCVLPLCIVTPSTGKSVKSDVMAELNSDEYADKMEDYIDGRNKLGSEPTSVSQKLETNKYARKLDRELVYGEGENVESDVVDAISTEEKEDTMEKNIDRIEELKKTNESVSQKIGQSKYATQLGGEQISGRMESVESNARDEITSEEIADMMNEDFDGLEELKNSAKSVGQKLEETNYPTILAREQISGGGEPVESDVRDRMQSEEITGIMDNLDGVEELEKTTKSVSQKFGKTKYSTKLAKEQISGGGETVESDVRGEIKSDKKMDMMEDNLDGLDGLQKTPKSVSQKLGKTKYATKLAKEQISGGGETVESDMRGEIKSVKKTEMMEDNLYGLEELKNTPKSVSQKLRKTKFATKLAREQISGIRETVESDLRNKIKSDKIKDMMEDKLDGIKDLEKNPKSVSQKLETTKYATKLLKKEMSGGGETVEADVMAEIKSDQKKDLNDQNFDGLEELMKTTKSVNQKLGKIKYATKLVREKISREGETVESNVSDAIKNDEKKNVMKNNIEGLEELKGKLISVKQKLEEIKYPTNLTKEKISGGGETLESHELAEKNRDEKFDLMKDNQDGLEKLQRKAKSVKQKSRKTKFAKKLSRKRKSRGGKRRINSKISNRHGDDENDIPIKNPYHSVKKVYNIGDSVLMLEIRDMSHMEKMGGRNPNPERRLDPNAIKNMNKKLLGQKRQDSPVVKVNIKQKQT